MRSILINEREKFSPPLEFKTWSPEVKPLNTSGRVICPTKTRIFPETNLCKNQELDNEQTP